MLTALFLLILVGVIWTVTGVVMGGVARKGLSPELTQAVSFLLGLLACLALLPLYPAPEGSGKAAAFALGLYFFAGVLNCFLNSLMAAAMKRGPNSLVWAILQAGMIVPFLVGVLCHDVHAGVLRMLGMAAVLAALALMSAGKDDAAKGKTGWLALSFLALLVVGIQQTVVTEPSYYPEIRSGIPMIHRCIALCAGNFAATLPFLVQYARENGIRGLGKAAGNRQLWRFAVLLQSSILFEILFLSFRAMDEMAKLVRGAISYPVMVISCIAAFTIYSIVFRHEKTTLRAAAGLALPVRGRIGGRE